MTAQHKYTVENADLWLDDLKERLEAHFERVVDWWEGNDIEWDAHGEAWTLATLKDPAPAWTWQGFWDLGWPEDTPFLPRLRGGNCFEATDLALDRVHPDFKELYFLSGCSPGELAEAVETGEEPVAPFPAEP